MINRVFISSLWPRLRPGWTSFILFLLGILLFLGLFGKIQYDARKDVPTSLVLDTTTSDWQVINKEVEYSGFYDVWLEIDHHKNIGVEGCLLDLARYGGQGDGDPNCKLKPLAKELDIKVYRDGNELDNWNEPRGVVYGEMLQIGVGGGGLKQLAKGDRIRAAIRLSKGWSALATFHPTLAIERGENTNDTENLYVAIQALIPLLLLLSIFAWVVEVTVKYIRSKQRRDSL